MEQDEGFALPEVTEGWPEVTGAGVTEVAEDEPEVTGAEVAEAAWRPEALPSTVTTLPVAAGSLPVAGCSSRIQVPLTQRPPPSLMNGFGPAHGVNVGCVSRDFEFVFVDVLLELVVELVRGCVALGTGGVGTCGIGP